MINEHYDKNAIKWSTNFAPRSAGRRESDKRNEKFLLWLILFAVGLSAVMFSAGYYVSAREAARMVLENEKEMNKAYQTEVK